MCASPCLLFSWFRLSPQIEMSNWSAQLNEEPFLLWRVSGSWSGAKLPVPMLATKQRKRGTAPGVLSTRLLSSPPAPYRHLQGGIPNWIHCLGWNFLLWNLIMDKIIFLATLDPVLYPCWSLSTSRFCFQKQQLCVAGQAGPIKIRTKVL